MFLKFDIKTIYTFYFKTVLRAKRTKAFFVFSLIPSLVLLILKLIEILNPESHISTAELFPKIILSFYFTLFIQILALFFGSSLLNDEIDNKTLVYLTTSPVSKSSIIIGKFIAHYFVSMIIIALGLFISFLISHIENILKIKYLMDLVIFISISCISLLAFSSFFTFLSCFLKKTILIGIFFIFGWEIAAQFIGGTAQRLTIGYYVNSLFPNNLPKQADFYNFRLSPCSTAESIIVLLAISIVFLILATIIFNKKEYVLATTA